MLSRKSLEWLKGRAIVFEGPDKSGKDDQIKLMTELLTTYGMDVRIARDPGGTPIGSKIRELLLWDSNSRCAECEALLYMASRAQLVRVIRGYQELRAVTLIHRWVHSTLAYQLALRGTLIQRKKDIAGLLDVYKYAVGGWWPDLTVVLNDDVETLSRRRSQIDSPDVIESRDDQYHTLVSANYTSMIPLIPGTVRLIQGGLSQDQTHHRILNVIRELALDKIGDNDDSSRPS